MWQTHDILQNNIDLSTVITIEDYQMNLKAKYRESPTAWHIPVTNKTIAIYPLCVEYLGDERILSKGEIVFINKDKNHNYQRVEAFKARAFEIFCEKIHPNIRHWKCFSNNCRS